MNNSNKTAIITGAGEGLGLALAEILAKEGMDLLLISLNANKLQIAKDRISRVSKGKILTLTCDLRNVDAVENIKKFIDDHSIKTDLLINNAGIGQFDDFISIDTNKIESMIALNVIFITKFTHLIANSMIAYGGGQILNIASTLGLRAAPDWAVYAATKAYIISFSKSISHEFKYNGISVSVACPGKIDTEFDKHSDNSQSDEKVKTSADIVALQIIKDLKKNKLIILPGLSQKLKYFLFKFFPDYIILKLISIK